MAIKNPKSARVMLTLNAGTNPTTGAMLKNSISLGKIVPGADANALSGVSDAVKTLLVKPAIMVSLVETSQIV